MHTEFPQQGQEVIVSVLTNPFLKLHIINTLEFDASRNIFRVSAREGASTAYSLWVRKLDTPITRNMREWAPVSPTIPPVSATTEGDL